MACNSFWGPTWLWQEALTSLVFPHIPICPVFLFWKLLHPFPKKKKSQPPYAPNFSFSAFLWFSFMNLSHFSTPTSNPGWNYCFPQHFHFSSPWDLLSVWFRSLWRVGKGTPAFSLTKISCWNVFSPPHQSPWETQKPQPIRGYIHTEIHLLTPPTLVSIKTNSFTRTWAAYHIRQLTINGPVPWGDDNRHFPLWGQTVCDGHTTNQVIPGPASPIPNHLLAEATSRKSSWVATKSVHSMSQATGSAAEEIPLQKECQPALEEPTSLGLCTQSESRADRWIWVSFLQREKRWQSFLSQLSLQSGTKTRIILSKAGFSEPESQGVMAGKVAVG